MEALYVGKTRNKQTPKSAPLKKSLYEKSNPSHYLGLSPRWAFKKMDTEHPRWAIGSCDSVYESIITKLRDYEGMTWQEIMSASGGRSSGTNNHFEDVADLCKEARDRMIELHMEDVDRIFSLRLTSKERLYGILEEGIFFVIWHDPNHEIYPT